MKENLDLEETKRKYEKSYKHEIFQILIENPEVRKKYNSLTKELIDIIDDVNKKNLKQDRRAFLEVNKWDKKFINKCLGLTNVFLVSKKFLFYENIEKLMERLIEVKSPLDIYNLIKGISKIYSFSNINEYYKEGIPNLELLMDNLKEQIPGIPKNSITKRMALEELQKKLEEYLHKIKK